MSPAKTLAARRTSHRGPLGWFSGRIETVFSSLFFVSDPQEIRRTLDTRGAGASHACNGSIRAVYKVTLRPVCKLSRNFAVREIRTPPWRADEYLSCRRDIPMH
ncbi:hypothetical protein VARIO8X_20267 [Burkholderiales bacterium 8X]|nr:hypothetical protein VARIO8X_20267 [Burkholderiales bacterium 8X]